MLVDSKLFLLDRESKVQEEEAIDSKINSTLPDKVQLLHKIQDKEIAGEDNKEVTNSMFSSKCK